jgi:hypothetical protein
VSVDIKAQFSRKEKPRNGLEFIAGDLVKDPMTPRYIVARVFVPTSKVNNIEGGAVTPVVQLDLIEPMLSASDEAAAKKLLDRAYKHRNGHLPPDTLLGVHTGDEDDDMAQDELPLDDDGGDGPI